MKMIFIVAASALALAGCFKEESYFDRCERNGLKIGSAEFKLCEKTLALRAIDAAETARLVEQNQCIKRKMATGLDWNDCSRRLGNEEGKP